ncbi:MAG: GNAT family N-acetyltransferase [Phycisphaerae bacterium]|jgi:ribosomal protein S18 acetylase RimI-like enzyme|nr:GNAT family N-acetyltransferase [Phycisphaerae bacterium]
MDHVEIQPVPRRSRAAAIKFLVAGTSNDRQTRAQEQVIQQMVSRSGSAAIRLWWSRSGRTTLAVALVVEGAGRISMLFFSPPDAPGVDCAQLVRLIGEISRDAVEGGMSLVQALIDPADSEQVAVLVDSGMMLLADLIYMSRNLLSRPPEPKDARDDLTWRNYKQFTEAQLGEVILQSYTDSLDCPALRGVREMPDIIAGHKCSGAFCPEAWWIVGCGDQATPAGCILVNDSIRGPSADIIYMGVAREFRRQGLAGAMLDRAIAQASERNRQAVSVAVDTRNDHAIRVYEQSGFSEIHRRLAYVVLKSGPKKPDLK